MKELINTLSNQYGNVLACIKDGCKQDTSNDGVFLYETEEGSCIQINRDGHTMWLSHDLYEQLYNLKLGGKL